MSEEDALKRMAEFRVIVDRKIRDLEEELKDLKLLKEMLDSILIEKGFKKPTLPQIPKEVETATLKPQPKEVGKAIPIKTVDGKLLANIYLEEGKVWVVPSEELEFRVEVPPFQNFLVERVLKKMRMKDQEASYRGEIPPEKIFNYRIETEGDIIKRIFIENVIDERVQELKSTIRWTFEKMYEKMNLPSQS